MIIGYLLNHFLGLLFALSIFATKPSKHPNLVAILRRGLASFHDCASFLAFSVEVAATVLLIQVDAGISTDGMGNDTVHIVFAVSMLVLLPLTYAVWTLPEQSRDGEKSSANRHDHDTNRSRRSMLLVICWALAFYPFFSAMNVAFGPNKISSRKNAALSPEQLQAIYTMCFDGLSPITAAEADVMISFIMLTYIPLSLILVSAILVSGIKSNHPDSAVHRRIVGLRARIPDRLKRYGVPFALGGIALLASGLFWAVFRARQAQRQLSQSVGAEDAGDNWTFGQVTAVTLFAPVMFACWDGFVSYRKLGGQMLVETETKVSE